tara:strand:- start:682 stop:957 length:276 start_codon:yes stop_codon:yes gene_type:complete
MRIRLPVSYIKVDNGWVELELLTASEAREEIGVSQYVWNRWCRKGLIPGHIVDRTERLYDWHQLDTAALGDGPIREFIRNRSEIIEEVNRA